MMRWLARAFPLLATAGLALAAPQRAAASASDMHSQGAVQTGVDPEEVSWVSAIIPIAALTVPHMAASSPRSSRIFTY